MENLACLCLVNFVSFNVGSSTFSKNNLGSLDKSENLDFFHYMCIH